MSEPDLIQRQREILRTCRQATTQRAKAEADVEARRKAEREAADTALNQARHTAAAQLAQAQKAQEQAQTTLPQAGLQRLLEETRPAPPTAHSGANSVQELARSVLVATEATKSTQLGVEALQQWRRAAASRRRLLTALTAVALFIAVVALLVLTVVGFLGYQRSQMAQQKERLYRSAVTALEAGQWEKARADLQQLASRDSNYKDAQTLLRESYYRSASAALEAKQWEKARAELQTLASIDSNYKDSKILLCESYYQPAVAAIQAGNWQEALVKLQELSKLDSNYKDVQLLLQGVYDSEQYERCKQAITTLFETGDWEKAKAILTSYTRDPELLLRELVAAQIKIEASAKGWSTYQVAAGDYMNSLVERLGVSKERLLSANVKYYPSIRDGSLSPGWLLLVPR